MLEQVAPLLRVALPGVEADVVPAGVDRRHDHHLVGHDLPGRARRLQAPLDEAALRGAEEPARRLEIGAGRTQLRIAAGLVVSVLALVEQDQVDRAPEAQGLVDPVAATLDPERGHALEVRLIARGAARFGIAQLGRQAAAGTGVAGVVVLHLVVVPDRDHRELGVHPAQRRLGAVQRVLGPVLVERLRVPDGVLADSGEGVAGPVVGLGVDVVAQVDDEVHILVGEQVVGVEVAERVVLAGEEGEAHRLARIGRQRGAEAADLALLAPGGEAVPVLLVRVEAGDASLYRIGHPRRRPDEVARHDLAKATVAGHLELHRARALHVGHARPQGDRVGRRVARDHALCEAPAAQARLAARASRPRARASARGGGECDAAGSG